MNIVVLLHLTEGQGSSLLHPGLPHLGLPHPRGNCHLSHCHHSLSDGKGCHQYHVNVNVNANANANVTILKFCVICRCSDSLPVGSHSSHSKSHPE